MSCETGQRICGIHTRVEEPLPPGFDDTALNNINLKCCAYDYQGPRNSGFNWFIEPMDLWNFLNLTNYYSQKKEFRVQNSLT